MQRMPWRYARDTDWTRARADYGGSSDVATGQESGGGLDARVRTYGKDLACHDVGYSWKLHRQSIEQLRGHRFRRKFGKTSAAIAPELENSAKFTGFVLAHDLHDYTVCCTFATS